MNEEFSIDAAELERKRRKDDQRKGQEDEGKGRLSCPNWKRGMVNSEESGR
jgi:hypothetical protein